MKGYIWLENNKSEKVLKEGLGPSDAGVLKLYTGSAAIDCIVAFLHPADARIEKNGMTCLKIKLDPEKTFIAEAASMAEHFNRTAVALRNYVLGTYRRPVVLIPYRPGPDVLEPYNGQLDEALLYVNSEELYVDRCFTLLDETDPGFREKALEAYWKGSAEAGLAVEISGRTETLPEVKKRSEGTGSGEGAVPERESGLKKVFRKYKTTPKTGSVSAGKSEPVQNEISTEYLAPDGSVTGIVIKKLRTV